MKRKNWLLGLFLLAAMGCLLVESGADVLDCRAEEVSLGEIFSALVGEGAKDVPKTAGVS